MRASRKTIAFAAGLLASVVLLSSALAWYRTREVVRLVHSLRNEDDEKIRICAIRRIGELRYEGAAEDLWNLAEKEFRRLECDPFAVTASVAFGNDGGTIVAVAEALAGTGGRAHRRVVRAATSGTSAERLLAALLLAASEGQIPVSDEVLRNVMANEDWRVRAFLPDILLTSRDQVETERLLDVLAQDANPVVRREAESAIDKIRRDRPANKPQ